MVAIIQEAIYIFQVTSRHFANRNFYTDL